MEDQDEADTSAEENDQLVIRSLLRERVLYVEINYFVVSNPDLQTSSYDVRLANGDPLPSWLRLDDKGGLLSGEPPVDVQDIQLRIEVTLSDGTSVVRYVSVDTFTGEITAMRDLNQEMVASAAVFTEQLDSVVNELEQARDDLISALQQ